MVGRNSKMKEMSMKKRQTSNVESSSEAKGCTRNCARNCHNCSSKGSSSTRNSK